MLGVLTEDCIQSEREKNDVENMNFLFLLIFMKELHLQYQFIYVTFLISRCKRERKGLKIYL